MVRGWLLAVIMASSLVLMAQPAGAAPEAAHAPPANAETSGHGGAGAEQQPDIFAYALDLTIWTIVVFGVLFLVLRAFAWKPMLEGLQQREHNIHTALEEAQRAREETQRFREQLKKEMDQAAEKVAGILEAARRDAERTTEEMVAKARTEIQNERDRLRREIEMARDQALQEIWNQTARLASVVSAKAIRRQISPEDHRRLVDEALAELGTAGKERQRQVASVQA